jgi:dihydrofolate reductase
MIAAIVAVDGNNGIGFDGELLERIPEDMKRFRALTEDNIIIMGRKTWDSLPSKPLPSRTNVVVSSKYCFEASAGRGRAPLVYSNMDYLIPDLLEPHIKDIFIIGGGSIYEQLLPYCDTVYMTRINIAHENVDTYFPHLDPTEWSLVEWSEWREYNGIPYRFLTYKRV